MNSKTGDGKAQKLEKAFLVVGAVVAIVGGCLIGVALFAFTTTTTVYDCEVVSVFNSTYQSSTTLETGEIITTEKNMSLVEFSGGPVGFNKMPNHDNLREGDAFQITIVDERMGERITYSSYGLLAFFCGCFLFMLTSECFDAFASWRACKKREEQG